MTGGRVCAVFGLWVWSLAAAPPLTTIQDVLFNADGTAFKGTLSIEWNSFDAADNSAIVKQSVSVPVVDGILRVQLVPTTNASPAANYRVRYNSNGRVQFEETWAVPPSTAPVKLRDVRLGQTIIPGPVQPPAELTEVQESDVVGLLTDLSIRPVKGPGYGPSRAAFIGASGELEAVVGNLADCVRVDGTAGPCGSSGTAGPGFVDGETPAGQVNGSNASFTLDNLPVPASALSLYRNGLLQSQNIDYTINGNVVTFTAAAVPQAGDILRATYRLADAGNPPGEAGGALTGMYPNPSLAARVISDINVADVAGIRESKLTLNYPTHPNANDPTADQKAALSGTAGTPSSANKLVTDQDARLADARTPLGHALLGGGHSDTSAAVPSRGDLIVGQGNAPATWKRLPLGPANRCLMSNGADAVWNTCLYTGFAAGSVPFVDAGGSLAQNNARLAWDNNNRRLSVGTNLGQTTVYIHDATPSTGTTGLTVRAGQGQGTDPLARWLDASGAELARVDAGGNISGASFRAASASKAGWQDAGIAADPASRTDGDFWFNTAVAARKTAEAGQTHTLPQVLCSSQGAGTSATSLTRLGSCLVPANFLKAGDRVEIRFDYSHEGSTADFALEVRWGGTPLLARNLAAAETAVGGTAEAGIYGGGAQWRVQSWGAGVAQAASAGRATDSLAAALTIDILGRMAIATTETVTLRNFTVVRYPAQTNP